MNSVLWDLADARGELAQHPQCLFQRAGRGSFLGIAFGFDIPMKDDEPQW